MKKVTVAALVAIMLIGAVSSAFAQAAGPKGGAPGAGQKPGQGQRGGFGKRMQEEVFAKLNLTPKQSAQIKAINEKYKVQYEALRPAVAPGKQRTPMSDADRKKFMAIREKQNAEFLAVLTPAQKTKFEALMKEMRAKMQNGGGRPGGGTPPPGGGKGKGGSTGGGI